MNTVNYKKHIIRDLVMNSDSCRICKGASDNILFPSVRFIVWGDYKYRANCVAKVIHTHLVTNYEQIKNLEPLTGRIKECPRK
jgi:hypothetical protein